MSFCNIFFKSLECPVPKPEVFWGMCFNKDCFHNVKRANIPIPPLPLPTYTWACPSNWPTRTLTHFWVTTSNQLLKNQRNILSQTSLYCYTDWPFVSLILPNRWTFHQFMQHYLQKWTFSLLHAKWLEMEMDNIKPVPSFFFFFFFRVVWESI